VVRNSGGQMEHRLGAASPNLQSIDSDAAQKWTRYDQYHHVALRPDQTERSRELEY
jgi:hypothetical protein